MNDITPTFDLNFDTFHGRFKTCRYRYSKLIVMGFSQSRIDHVWLYDDVLCEMPQKNQVDGQSGIENDP